MNKYILIWMTGFCLLMNTYDSCAQQRGYNKKMVSGRQKFMQQSPFFNEQWWVGIKGGLSTAKAMPAQRYAVLQSVNAESTSGFDKEYMDYEYANPGTTIGLIGTYSFWNSLSVSLQPTYSNQKFGYKTHYLWEQEGAQSMQLDQKHRFSVSYLEVPLRLRYDVHRSVVRPYVHGGVFYGRLLKADKSMEVHSLDAASGAVNPIANSAPVIGARDLFIRTNIGWLAGGGINYDMGSIRIGFDICYKQGFENVSNRRNRFSDHRMVGVGDVMDDMKLRNWEASFTLLFPLKFLDTGAFQPAKP